MPDVSAVPPQLPSVSAMSQALPPEPGGIRVGAAISTSFAVWRANLLPFSALNLVATLPLLAYTAALGDALPGPGRPAAPSDLDAFARVFFPLWGLGMITMTVQVGALTSGVVQHLAGRRPRLGAMVGAGLRHLLPLVAVGLLAYLGFLLGFVLLVVPGVLFALAASVVVPALVAERPGVLGAFRRSFRLTKGSRLAILAVFLVFFVISAVVGALAGLVLPFATAGVSRWIGFGVSTAVNVVMGSLYWIVPAVVYHQLRVSKEGVDAAQLAAVFE